MVDSTGSKSVQGQGRRKVWELVLADLRRRLDADEFICGFPGELALANEYSVSRHTVRHAVSILRDEGLVVGSRGRPSRQAEPEEIAQRLGTLYSLYESVQAAGLEQRSIVRVLAVEVDRIVAARLGLAGSAPLLYLERLRFAGDEPLALDRVWLPYELAAPLLGADFSTGALYERYARLCGVVLTGGEEAIQPILPTVIECQLLGTPSTVAFSINRLGTAKGRPVEWRQTIVRGDRFVLRTDFAEKDGYHLDFLVHPDMKNPSA